MNRRVLIAGKLELQVNDDGVWLHFINGDGPHAALNLSAGAIGGPLVRRAIRNWCKEIKKGAS